MIKKTLLTLAIAGVASIASAASVAQPVVKRAASSGDGQMYGYNSEYNVEKPRGLYQISSTGEPDLLWYDELAYPEGPGGAFRSYTMLSGWIRNGKLCGIEGDSFLSAGMYKYVEHDLEDGEILEEYDITVSQTDWTNYFMTATYCPMNDRIYGFGYNRGRNGYSFKSAPAGNLKDATLIKGYQTIASCALGLAFDTEKGELYGYTGLGEIVRIDVNTGDMTTVFEPGFVASRITDFTGMCYDPVTGYFYLNFCYQNSEDYFCSYLYELDMEKKTARRVCDYGVDYQFNFLVVNGGSRNVSATAPAQVTDLEQHFGKDDVDGTFTFTLPEKTSNGSELTGNVSWKLYIDGTEYKSGEGAPGEKVTVNASVPKGFHFIRVQCASNGTEGLSSTIMPLFGGEVPVSPANVRLSRTEVKWDAVNTSITGESIDPKDVTYEVMIGNKTIGNTSDTKMSVVEFMNSVKDEELTPYNALVFAKLGNNTSKAAESNVIVYGMPEELPYKVYPTPDQAELIVAIDGNSDNLGWEYYKNQEGSYVFLSGWNAGTNDWMFLPQVAPDGVESVDFSGIFQAADNELLGGSIEVYAGTEASIEAMKTVVIPEYTFNVAGEHKLTGTVMMKDDLKDAKELVFGIRAINKNEKCPLYAYLMNIEEGDSKLSGPGSVSDIEIAEDENDMKFNISFKLPTKTADGKSLASDAEIRVAVKAASTVHVTGKPGEKVTASVPASQGDNLIIITPSVNNVKGEPVSKVMFTGDDIPGTVSNFRITFDETNCKMRVEWDAPTEGYYGGTLSDKRFSYEVYYYDAEEDGFVFATDVPIGLNFATLDFTGASQQLVNAGVRAKNKAGTCPELSLFTCIVGTPYKLPMVETFEGDELFYNPLAHYRTGEYANATWEWRRPASIDAKYGEDTGYAYVCRPTVKDAKSRIDFPKFSTEGYQDVKIEFRMWNGKNAAESRLKGTFYWAQPDEKLIETIKAGNEDTYATKTIVLPSEMWQNPWVALSLESDYKSVNDITIISEYKIGGIPGGGGSVEEFETIYGSVTGNHGSITVYGYEGAEVSLYTLDGKLIKKVSSDAEHFTFPAAGGMYVVRVGNQTSKVMVK